MITIRLSEDNSPLFIMVSQIAQSLKCTVFHGSTTENCKAVVKGVAVQVRVNSQFCNV